MAADGLLPGLARRPGRGRALGVGEVKFTGMVLPSVKKVEYVVDFKRVILRRLKLAIADGTLKADGQVIYRRPTCASGCSRAATQPAAA